MNCLTHSSTKTVTSSYKKARTKYQPKGAGCNLDKRDAGFSIIELLIVLSVVSIMTSVTIFSFLGNKKAYQTDDRALRIMDFMRDAKERALSHRQVMRLEIDTTINAIQIIDEKTVEISSGKDTHSNDRIVRQESLDNPTGPLRVDVQPSNIAVLPNINTTSTPVLSYPMAVYAVSSHPLSAGHNVWAVRFQSNGSITGPADASAAPISATVLVWQPDGVTNYAAPLQSVRAITLFGGAGTIKYWQYDGSNFVGR